MGNEGGVEADIKDEFMSETQESFDYNQRQLVDEGAKETVYLDFPKLKMDKILVDHQRVSDYLKKWWRETADEEFRYHYSSIGTDQKLTYGFEINHNDASRLRDEFENGVKDGSYKSNPENKVLHDISLKFVGGKMTALVGLSGSGKSTLLNMIPRIYLPTSGNIYFDNHDDLLEMYPKSRALIFPSNYESFGIPLIEAKNFNLPILAGELDYIREGRNMALYRLMLAKEETVHVPDLIETASTDRLLTMTWLDGVPILDFIKNNPELEMRNLVAKNMFRAWYVPFYLYGIIHGDPHLGNCLLYTSPSPRDRG